MRRKLENEKIIDGVALTSPHPRPLFIVAGIVKRWFFLKTWKGYNSVLSDIAFRENLSISSSSEFLFSLLKTVETNLRSFEFDRSCVCFIQTILACCENCLVTWMPYTRGCESSSALLAMKISLGLLFLSLAASNVDDMEEPAWIWMYDSPEGGRNCWDRRWCCFCVWMELKLNALRMLWRMLKKDSLPTRKRRVGRHVAITARPPSIMDQYSMVETVTFWRLVNNALFHL